MRIKETVMADNSNGKDCYDLYDESFLVDRECPKCGSRLISHPTDETTCSNRECEFYDKALPWE